MNCNATASQFVNKRIYNLDYLTNAAACHVVKSNDSNNQASLTAIFQSDAVWNRIEKTTRVPFPGSL
jgi:hypothetical protein